MSRELIAKKAQRDYTDKAADLQESDTGYLAGVRAAYRELAAEQGWLVVSVSGEAGLRSMEAITMIWKG